MQNTDLDVSQLKSVLEKTCTDATNSILLDGIQLFYNSCSVT